MTRLGRLGSTTSASETVVDRLGAGSGGEESGIVEVDHERGKGKDYHHAAFEASGNANFDPLTGALRLSHRPAIGTDAYACILYPRVDLDVIERYEGIHRARTSRYVDIHTVLQRGTGTLERRFRL
jgi:hypothetical protein